jgi:hypothetical protein
MHISTVFSISSLVPSKQGGIPLSSSMLPPSTRMVSFDWNDLVEPLLPSFKPFLIVVRVNSIGIFQTIVDEGSFASILSSSAWKALDYPKLVSSTNELLDFDRIPSDCLGILP